MNARKKNSAILLIQCADRKGIVAAVTKFLFENDGNIIDLDQHVDAERQTFYMRVEWDVDSFAVPRADISGAFSSGVAERFAMQWKLYFSDEKPRMAVFVSRLPHCLYDILARCRSGEWRVEVPLVISNHPELEDVARLFGVEYHCLPVTEENKLAQEARQIELLESRGVDFIVLARYMQILTPEFISRYPNRIINIHHAFLPAFPGARPYHSAFERGVKVIGATSHYVTEELDAGPIIEQDVVRASHRDAVGDLVRKGRDLEKIVLSRAVWYHLQRKILVSGNRTVLFI